MNDLLRDTLAERAAGTEPPPLDLDGIIAAGNHRAARRRTLGILGGAVATAAVAVSGASVLRPRNEQPQPAWPGPFTQRRATFALGNEIHYGSEVISVAPHTVTAFVQTDAGFVFLNAENAIHVADRSGVRSLGKSAWRLTADHRGDLVGWVETHNDQGESIVYDVAAGRELVRTPIGNKIPKYASIAHGPEIVAIDGNTAYFGTLDGLYRWDIRTNRGEFVAKVSPVAVRTVTAGQMVYQQPLEQADTGHDLKVGPTLTSGNPTTYVGQQAFLSPDARYLVTQADDAQPGAWPLWAGMNLFGVTATRDAAMPREYSAYRFGQWLDETTFSAVGVRHGSLVDVVSLITYNARTSALSVVARNFSTWTFSKTAPRTTPFALPTGKPIIDRAE
ncbi:hypothetical protein EV649_4471 [Kribbella sp. VKM Ac-2569]|uniref:hypothetical protein n=1 Tax=Kribbella sp. VKM Ac-2569 TaxID=2512220 RepID=UPI00102AF84E|nr:hypothetical protein [Kribbella sp. VKM Ac-2569]RZT16936.1 hypothetical protein EV649_4471 [Kribbella sp. VKM Ac-2569]